jgi:hypothetical protein
VVADAQVAREEDDRRAQVWRYGTCARVPVRSIDSRRAASA